VGANSGNVMGFGKRDGKRQWASENTDPAGHCGGMSPMTVGGVPCLAVLTLRNLVVVRVDRGKEGRTLGQYEWITDFGNNVATPAVQDNFVLVTSEYNRNAICKLEVSEGNIRKVWEKRHASKACSPVIHNGHVYWAWQRLHCLDFATGERKWDGGSFGDPGSVIVTADGRLIVWGERGKLVLAESADRSPDAYKELARSVRVTDSPAWPHVVLADGRLYCKDREGALKCFALKPRP
jgi:outer membrane protein assembly factor BamB